MSDQKTYRRFTPSAWNIIKNVKFNEKEQEKLNSMIVTKTKTIAQDEVKAMLYVVVHGL